MLEIRRSPSRTRPRVPRYTAALVAVAAVGLLLVLGARSHASTPPTARSAAELDALARSWAPGAERAVHGRSSLARAAALTETRMPYVAVGGRRRRDVALTFDDGPGPYTAALVRVLNRLRVPATFFQIGTMVWAFPATERLMARDRRFAFGDHTESHPPLGRLTAALQWEQIVAGAQAPGAEGVRGLRLFRPPYGSFDATTLEIAHHLHLLPVLWTIDSEDYTRPGVAPIVDRVLGDARPGAIVLMHDAGGDRSETIAALPAIVRGLRRRGFRLVTVPRMLLDDPPPERQPPASGNGAG